MSSQPRGSFLDQNNSQNTEWNKMGSTVGLNGSCQSLSCHSHPLESRLIGEKINRWHLVFTVYFIAVCSVLSCFVSPSTFHSAPSVSTYLCWLFPRPTFLFLLSITALPASSRIDLAVCLIAHSLRCLWATEGVGFFALGPFPLLCGVLRSAGADGSRDRWLVWTL